MPAREALGDAVLELVSGCIASDVLEGDRRLDGGHV